MALLLFASIAYWIYDLKKPRKASYQHFHSEAENLFNKFISVNNDTRISDLPKPEYIQKLEEEVKTTREKYIRLRAKYWHDEKELLQLAQDWLLYMGLFFYEVYLPEFLDDANKTLKLEKTEPEWTVKQDFKDSKVTLEELVRRFDRKLEE